MTCTGTAKNYHLCNAKVSHTGVSVQTGSPSERGRVSAGLSSRRQELPRGAVLVLQLPPVRRTELPVEASVSG